MNEYQHGSSREGSGHTPVYEGPTKVIQVHETRVLEINTVSGSDKKTACNDIASITLVEARTHSEIPVALQKVAASFPSPRGLY